MPLAFHPDAPAVGFDDPTADGEPESSAAVVMVAVIVAGAKECAEHVGRPLRGHSMLVVGH